MIARYAVIATIVSAAIGICCFVVPWNSKPISVASAVPASFEHTPSDPQASTAVRETMGRLSDYMQSNAKVLSGQNVGHATDDLLAAHYRSWTRLTKFREQAAPAMMGIDLGLNEIPQNASPILKIARPHCEAGGLLSISMHPSNPWTEGPYDDLERGKVEDLLQPGHPAHTRWMDALDRAAHILKSLEQNQIVVLWRPLHEANGYWFWWCGDNDRLTPSQYKQLWRHMYRYFTVNHDLHNLIWVYSANAQVEKNVRSPLDYYPGDDVVDVVGIDFYGPDISQVQHSYDELLSTNKILGLTEFGGRPMDGSMSAANWLECMEHQFPHFAYFVFWHSWPAHSVAIADQREVQSLMNAERVHHRRDLASQFAAD